jgi:energy-coupling factor transporter ATP-binding protein EcfA2
VDLTSFRITNYRNILDSGDVEVGKIVSIVGQNECGKSNLLQALACLNAFDGAKYVLTEDWPIDRWPPSEGDPVVCQATFRLTPTEIQELIASAVAPAAEGDPPVIAPAELLVTVSKGYNNVATVNFGDWSPRLDQPRADQFVLGRLPKCVYMSDYETFQGFNANFFEVFNRYRAGQTVTQPERTLMIAMELASLELDKVHTSDAPRRTFYTTAASGYLTRRFANLWKQRAIEFDIRVDGNHLSVYVKDSGLNVPIPLARRSAGFQWYVSFIWRFTHASGGEFKNCILLLDEPGVKLHHAGHADLLEFLASLSKSNTVLYTTHLATMIDPSYPERIRIMEVKEHHGHVVNWVVSGQRKPMMVIEARLGLTGSMSGLLGSRQNLVVEGVDDMLILQKLSGVLRTSGLESLSDRIFVLPAHGASSTPLYAAFMIGNEFDAAVLVDSDQAGREALDKIRKQDVPAAAKASQTRFRLFELGKLAGSGGLDFAIEDMFPADFYLGCINEAYGTNLNLSDLGTEGTIAHRCRVILKARGRITDELDAKLIMTAIQKQFNTMIEARDLPAGTVDKALKVIAAINATFA